MIDEHISTAAIATRRIVHQNAHSVGLFPHLYTVHTYRSALAEQRVRRGDRHSAESSGR